jgi:hypothetical protein
VQEGRRPGNCNCKWWAVTGISARDDAAGRRSLGSALITKQTCLLLDNAAWTGQRLQRPPASGPTSEARTGTCCDPTVLHKQTV